MAELTISEAAVALGVSVDTIRRKIKRGELRARQDNKGRYLVAVEAPPRGAAPAVAGAPGNAAETARLRLDLEHAEAMVAELRHQREVLEGELQGARQAMQDAATERSELRRLLGNAQMQLRALLPGPAEGEAQKPGFVAERRPKRWWWPF